jgi:hypothetical protein
LERLLHEADRRYEQRFSANAEALATAERALHEYKAGSNEWRDALKDANARMATRLDLEKLEEDVQELQRAKANLDGRLVATAGVISVVVSAVLWALMQFFK